MASCYEETTSSRGCQSPTRSVCCQSTRHCDKVPMKLTTPKWIARIGYAHLIFPQGIARGIFSPSLPSPGGGGFLVALSVKGACGLVGRVLVWRNGGKWGWIAVTCCKNGRYRAFAVKKVACFVTDEVSLFHSGEGMTGSIFGLPPYEDNRALTGPARFVDYRLLATPYDFPGVRSFDCARRLALLRMTIQDRMTTQDKMTVRNRYA